MIDLAKYTGVDDSNFAIKLGMVDELAVDRWAEGGPIVSVTYVETSPEERKRNRESVQYVAGLIKARVESGK